MGVLDRAGNFLKGGWDIVSGTGEFLVDITKGVGAIANRDVEDGMDQIFSAFQEDLMGKVMQGAFGPEGMVGTVIGGLPEFIRKPGREIIEPMFKYWDWTIQNVVDRPLGTFTTIVNVVREDKKNIFKAFDASTWAAAWEINDKRTFGQSVAAMVYNIDPFDDDEYDSIQDDAFFNLLSGTADFFQEFIDPVGIALGGGANILRGKTVISRVNKAGDVVDYGRRTSYQNVGGMIKPQKIYTPGGGVFAKGFKGERLNPNQLAARELVAKRFSAQRAQATINSRRWKNVQKNLDDLEKAEYRSRMGPGLTEGLGEGGVKGAYSGLFEIGGPSKELINQRYGVLRQTLGRKGSKMPEETAYALAKAPTAEARDVTLRFLMGDLSVLEEAAQKAGTLNKLLESPDFLDNLAEYDRLDNLVKAQEESQKLGVARGGDRSMQITKNRLKMEEIGKKLSDDMGETAINSVDWNTIYDGYLGVLETRNRKVVDIDGNPTPGSQTQMNLFEGNEDLRAISQRVIEDIVALENKKAGGLVTGVGEVSTQFGTLNKWYSDPMGRYRKTKISAMRNRVSMTPGARLGEGIEFMAEEYAMPSVITPGGVRKFRMSTERLPQALINFSDKHAFTQWERVLQAASRVRIGGEAIINIREINNLLGQWTELSTKHGENNAVFLKELFDGTVDNLAIKADDLLKKNNIIVEESLESTLKRSRTFKDEIADRAGSKTRGTERKGRRAMSLSSDRKTTYNFTDADGTHHTVHSALTPQQMRGSGIVPRWDLINKTIKNKAKKVDVEAKKVGWDEAADPFLTDIRQFKRGVEKVKDGFRIVGGGTDVAATKVMQIWRPAVLLTPKWPMRVQLDEFFRRAADLGVMTELSNLMRAVGDMKDVYANHGVEMSLDTVARKIMERAKKDNLGDALRHLESTGVSIDDVMKDHASSVIRDMGTAKKYVPKAIQDKFGGVPKVMFSRAGLARLGVSAVLFGPFAGLVHGVGYGVSRYRRINKTAHRQAGITVADGLMYEGRRLLTEAVGPDAPPGLRQQAELMISRGEGMRKAIDDITPEGADIENIVDNMEKAHALLAKGNLANPTIYGATVRNAYGDNPAFREITTKSIATNKAVSGMVDGVRKTQQRELTRFVDPDWEIWDSLDPNHSNKIVSDGWGFMMDSHRQASNIVPKFYEIVWDHKTPRHTRIKMLEQEFKTNRKLAKELNIEDLHHDPNPEAFYNHAENVIDEFDDILPQFDRNVGDFPELADGFNKLRERTMSGEIVAWSEVVSTLKKAEKARVARLNLLSTKSRKGKISRQDAIEFRVDKTDVDFTQPGMFEKELGDPDFFVERTVNELIDNIRTNRGFPGFGKSISPNMRTVDLRHGQKAGHLGNMIQRLFKVFGETPADQLSRNPYFRTKYQREVSRRLAYFMDESGNVNLSQNKLFEIEEEARKYAIGETRDLLYDLAEETRISEILTHVAPFYNAWQEVLGRWAHLAVENPYFVAKAAEVYTSEWDAEFLGIEQITTYEEVEIGKKEQELGRSLTDKEKEDHESGSYLVWRLPNKVKNISKILTPGPLGEVLRNQDIRFSKEGLASMLQSTTPGFGPLVTVPIREAVLRDPKLEEAFGFMFPFGHPEGNRAIAGFLPAWQQNFVNRFSDTDTKKRVVQALAQQLYVEADEAGRPIDLSNKQQVAQWIDEANSRANSFFTFRIATGLFSPTSTTAISPYAELMQDFKHMRGRYGEKEANALFLRTHGEELFGLTARMTRLNDGVASSIEAEEGYQKHQDLIQAHPEIGAWVSGSIGATDEKFTFSQAAYRRQMNMDLSPETPDVKRRERMSPFETMAQTEIRLGWMKYTDLNERVRTYQAQREALGLSSSLNSTVMAPIAKVKRGGIARIKEEHPAWAVEFVSGQKQERMVPVVEGFLEILNNPDEYLGLISRPSMQHILKYFELRGMVEQILVMRAKKGKGNLNLEHSTNDDLSLWWENQKQAMGQLPQFSETFDRFFEYDLIPEQSFVSVLGA